MKSVEYRAIVAKIVRNSLRKDFPGLKLTNSTVCHTIARAIHARMYGANVDGVDSPIWRDDAVSETNPNGSRCRMDAPPNLPKLNATELLKTEDEK